VPSGTTYGHLLGDAAARGEQVLALGDPDYGVAFDPRALEAFASKERGRRFAPLPATREEAKAVGDVTLLGRDASEAGLRAAIAAKGARWHGIHFACHGLVDPERPRLCSLALTPDAGNDGFLTALEVLRSEIPADLVVLSACETSKGRIIQGEGIVGLTRAFMFAGSPRVVCSLWKVDDDATRALMTRFYALWNPKDGSKPMGTAAALRAAQEHVRSQERWKRPYYWAAWVLWGLPD
jgi:CHAT domain-containing protein